MDDFDIRDVKALKRALVLHVNPVKGGRKREGRSEKLCRTAAEQSNFKYIFDVNGFFVPRSELLVRLIT